MLCPPHIGKDARAASTNCKLEARGFEFLLSHDENKHADMMELLDMPDLGSGAVKGVGVGVPLSVLEK